MVTVLLFVGLLLVQSVALFALAVLAKRHLAKVQAKIYADLADQVTAWVVSPGKDDKGTELPSALGQLVGQLGDILAERLFIRFKMSVQGERSGLARREKGQDSPGGMPGMPPWLAILSKFAPGVLGNLSGMVDTGANIIQAESRSKENFSENLNKWR